MQNDGWVAISEGLPECKKGGETEVMVCYEDNGHSDYTRVFAYYLNKSVLFEDENSEHSKRQTGFFKMHENCFEPIYDVKFWHAIPAIPKRLAD